MSKKFVWVMIALMLFARTPHAFALRELISVTRETQASQGVDFTLSAVRVDDTAVIVRMEIPKKGKLINLKTVTMNIGTGRPLVHADLETTPGKDGSLVVSFQLSPELADKCDIFLGPLAPDIPTTSVYYAVQLKGYVTVRK